MSFIYGLNEYLTPLFTHETWGSIEMTCAVLVFFIGIWERTTISTFLTSYRSVARLGVLMAQFSLFMQLILSMIICVDGYTTFIEHEFYNTHPSHVIIILIVLSMAIKKISNFMTHNKNFIDI